MERKQEDELSSLLSEFARTLLTDFSIQDILDHLVERIVDALPISAAGVTLIAPGIAPQYIAASDDSALRYEKLQTELGEGPCLLAYESGEAVTSTDLRGESRFPRFTAAALEAGLAAAFTFPLRHAEGQLGALDLYRDTPGSLEPSELAAAQTLADVAAAYVLNAQAREQAAEASDRFRDSSLHDPLTGLPNRLLLQQRLQHAAKRAERSHTNAAVLFADLDRFKSVNDEFGHQIGDELLVAVAERLQALVRPGDTLSRLSGDEFVFLCEDMAHPADIESLARRIEHAIAQPFTVSGIELSVTASVGMAYAGPGEAVTTELIVNADHAMYEAKKSQRSTRRIIDLREAHQITDRNTLIGDLKDALTRDELEIAYQPIVRSTDGLVTGVEALLRWTHPNRGAIPASHVISIAEDNGLIADIGAWVLEASCQARGQWLVDYPDTPLSLSVNVSTRQLMGPGFAALVADVLQRTGMDPSALVLEMTEGIFIQDSDRATTVLEELKLLGVQLALDDFGTGYSSLSYLHKFPVDIIKIDKGFLASVTLDVAAGAIVEAVTKLAHVLGLAVVAEGVETTQQRDKVIALGCDSSQGYLYARPMPPRDMVALLEASPQRQLHLPAQQSRASDV